MTTFDLCYLSTVDFDHLRDVSVVLDMRTTIQYQESYIPGAINAPVGSGFESWLYGVLGASNTPVLLVVEQDNAEESLHQLQLAGIENIAGILKGGMEAWKSAGNICFAIEGICPGKYWSMKHSGNIIDIRDRKQYAEGSLPGAISIPLVELKTETEVKDKSEPVYLLSAHGKSAIIAAGILKRMGFTNVFILKKGYIGIMNQKANPCACQLIKSN